MDEYPLVSAVSAILLSAIVIAFIVSQKFRSDVLGGTGEAKLGGILSVTGAAVVLLCSLFLFGMIYPITLPSSLDRIEPAAKQMKKLEWSLFQLQLRADSDQNAKNELGASIKELGILLSRYPKEAAGFGPVVQIDDSGKKLQSTLTKGSSDQTINSEMVKELRKCLQKIGVSADTLLVDFLYGREFASKRAQAVTCLNG